MIPMWTENVTVAFLEVPMVHILNQCNTVLWKFGVQEEGMLFNKPRLCLSSSHTNTSQTHDWPTRT